jgi:hypothetical protein
MAFVPSEAEQLISTYQLGAVRQVYKPRTRLFLTTGLFLIASAIICAVLVVLMILSLSASSRLPSYTHGSGSSGDPLSGIFILSWLTLCQVIWGAWMLIKAFLNRQVLAVLCAQGVVLRGDEGVGAFRWEQALTVSHVVKNRPLIDSLLRGSVVRSPMKPG